MCIHRTLTAAALEQSKRKAPHVQQKSQRFSEFFSEATINNVDLDAVILKGLKHPSKL
jgi:hypothetical protein